MRFRSYVRQEAAVSVVAVPVVVFTTLSTAVLELALVTKTAPQRAACKKGNEVIASATLWQGLSHHEQLSLASPCPWGSTTTRAQPWQFWS